MTVPIKLTEEWINDIAQCLDSGACMTTQEAKQVIISIRELRDRAKTLVASATHWTDMDGKDAEIDVTVESFNALQEVLP